MKICGNRDCEDGSSFSKNLAVRLWGHWCLKAIGTTLFIAIFFAIYFYLLRNPYFSITQMPLTAVDGTVGFQPYFLYLYLSLWLYVSLAPALIKTKRELIYYGLYIGVMCTAGVVIYILFPTTIPQIGINWSHYPEFSALKTMDSSGNAFPSLHVATAFFSLFWIDRHLKQMHAHPALLWLNGLWCFGIVYSTMAIKQHVFLDVVGGVILGGTFAVLTLHYHRTHFHSVKNVLN
ncbi:MAG: phosphatase PAP2 family protein [Thiovulaceae bacterium]|nr:phosphatase PAP2 family protein [Sulfurimonadaceae bacterium]